MTTALGAISSHCLTKPIDAPPTTIMSNHTLNAFLQGLLERDDGLGEEEDYIDDDGAVDDDKRDAYMARQEEEDERKRNLLLTLMNTVEIEALEQREADAEDLRRHRQRFLGRRKKTRKFKRQWYCDPVTGKMRRVTPKLSGWWLDYIENPEPDCPSWNKVFRQRFRLPYLSYIEILEWVTGDGCDGLFDRWRAEADGYTGRKNNKKVSPIELLLLGTLRYLGRGWTFDDIEEGTKVSREVHRCFFHAFTTFGAKFLYPRFVHMPHTTSDLQNCESEYAMAGFPGCIGSTDATHIPLDKVTAAFRQTHIGYKMGSETTSRTYNLTVNHRRQILHTTTGHPGRWNDKTLIRFDTFMSDLRDGVFDERVNFELKRGGKEGRNENENDNGEDVVTIKGAYVIVDNGYLRWPTTIPPMKDAFNKSEQRFSQWLESLRKDVECTFGILKGRWRILKTGIRCHNTEVADNVWMTCCALHNHLLDVDGLSSKWNDGIASAYEKDDGQFQDDDIPLAIRRLVDPAGNEGHRLRMFDGSRFGLRDADCRGDDDQDNEEIENVDPNRTELLKLPLVRSGTSVSAINFHQFRAMLIDNFNIAFHKNELKWPRRYGKNSRPVSIL
jgi:DDE superfamily endonuclease